MALNSKDDFSIGYTKDTYAEKRLIINKIPELCYTKTSSNSNALKKLNLSSQDLRWSEYIDHDENINILHLFNQVNFGSATYISTFESTIPRFTSKNIALGLPHIADKKCKKIIAFSESTKKLQYDRIINEFVEYSDVLKNKLEVVHPPQSLIPNNIVRFDDIVELNLCFVGSAFFRKGGAIILNCLKKIRDHFPIRLTIISDMNLGYNVTKSSQDDILAAEKFIKDSSDWIDWYKRIPNESVLDIIANSHLGLLPTLADTYGYSVLEMQAAGTPVITTDIRALPEINSLDVGWLLSFDNTRGASSATSKEELDNIYSKLEHQLFSVISSIIEHPEILIEKSISAQKRINKEHSPSGYAKKIFDIINCEN